MEVELIRFSRLRPLGLRYERRLCTAVRMSKYRILLAQHQAGKSRDSYRDSMAPWLTALADEARDRKCTS